MQGRRIRDAMFNLYLDEISKVIQNGMMHFLSNVGDSKDKPSITEFVVNANQHFENLCGIYPYHKVKISFLNKKEESTQKLISFFGLSEQYIGVTLEENPCFPPVIGFSPPDRRVLIVNAVEHGLYQVAINYNLESEN